MTSDDVRRFAHQCGFELAGVAKAEPSADAPRYLDWAARGLAGEMRYLADRRAGVREDPRNLLAGAQSIVCVGKLYNASGVHSTAVTEPDRAWISRYAWGAVDYHSVVRRGLQDLAAKMSQRATFDYKICVDTAPLLERSYARQAGLGWIGRNTCLINQWAGSWLFLGELLVSLDIEPCEEPAANRCGTCTRCVDACPTRAIVLRPDGTCELDSRLCISYLTIELKGPMPVGQRDGLGLHVFGCDICQDVCPWNRREAVTLEPDFRPQEVAPPLDRLARLTEVEFRARFADTPVIRASYRGFLRNVAVAMGNARLPRFRGPLERLADYPHPTVAEHARWALDRMPGRSCNLSISR